MNEEVTSKKLIDYMLWLKNENKVKKIDFENIHPIGCIPTCVMETEPTDQSKPITKEDCPSCGLKIWVSKMKREKKANNDTCEIYCIGCVMMSAQIQGLPLPELVNIAKMN